MPTRRQQELAIYLGAYDLLRHRSHWTKRAYARVYQSGKPTSSFSPEAKCWCLLGALERASGLQAGEYLFEQQISVITTMAAAMFPTEVNRRMLSRINDDIGYDAVMSLLRASIYRIDPTRRLAA